ncbi:integrase core domain-containing protein [Mesobacterium pallidum]|uniref:integrase core domain-containing protein n=1 Tax=Mesobacterium pallidum TaxID=2872037 RepID=UPI002342E4A9|nr:integrase core domain-containing protein [Mesobacterium pallidum]
MNGTLFQSLTEARDRIEAWKTDHSRHRPYSSLGHLTPLEFALKSRLDAKAA